MNEIPKSDALTEVGEGALSISELLSRDPETLSEADFDRQIALLRAQAERWFEAERLGLNKKRGAQKSLPITESKEDMTDSGL